MAAAQEKKKKREAPCELVGLTLYPFVMSSY
jgi:hypothetical protein